MKTVLVDSTSLANECCSRWWLLIRTSLLPVRPAQRQCARPTAARVLEDFLSQWLRKRLRALPLSWATWVWMTAGSDAIFSRELRMSRWTFQRLIFVACFQLPRAASENESLERPATHSLGDSRTVPCHLPELTKRQRLLIGRMCIANLALR